MQFKFFLFLCTVVASFGLLVRSATSEGIKDEFVLSRSRDVLIQNYSETGISTMERNSISTDISLWKDFPILPSVFASSNTIPDGRCKNQTRRYLQNLANSTLWAVQMFDASTKYPDGIIFGHTRHLGNFDQCYDLRARLSPDGNDPELYEDDIEGRYCLIRFRYHRKNVSSMPPKFFSIDFDPNQSAWDAIDDRGDFRRVKRNDVYLALCVPSSCTAKDVEIAITDPLEKFAEDRGIGLKIEVKPSLCQARSDLPENFSTGSKVFCFLITALLLLVIGSSWYDSSHYSAEDVENEIEPRDLFLCFSARRNLRSIFASSSGSHPELESIHFWRFFCMFLVIFGHRSGQYFTLPMVDSTYFEKLYTVPLALVLFNGTVIVEAFFSIGGLLLAYFLLEELDRNKRINFGVLILARFLRLTPLHMMVVFFHATVFPLMGSGPYWQLKIGSEGINCAKNWWTNLFYINNYVNANESCIFQSWYLSADYQLHIIGLFVLWIFWRLPRKLGYTFLSLLITIGIAITFYITYAKNLQPIFLVLPSMTDIREDPFFLNEYNKPHLRIASYFIGVLAGVIIYDYKGATWKLPKVWSWILVISAICLAVADQSRGRKYYDPNSVLNPLETAAYAGFHRAIYAFAACLFIASRTIGDGLDSIYNFLTPRWLPPLARLNYAAYLIHSIHQIYEAGVTRTPRVFSAYNIIREIVQDTVYTYALSLLLSIVVEGPLRRIEKFILQRFRTPSRNSTEMTSLTNETKKTN